MGSVGSVIPGTISARRADARPCATIRAMRPNGAADGDSASRRRARGWLLAVSLFSLAPRLVDGALRPIDYNGYWHVFIARNLPREWRRLPHPPLFLVLLRAADAVSHSVFAYRLVSLVAGAGVVYLTGRILLALGTLPSVTVLGALAMALAGNAITLSNEVQSYSLALLFLLASFVFYLDLTPESESPPFRSRAGFAILASLALLTHYFAGLYLVACVLAPAVIALVRPSYRRAAASGLSRRWRADLLNLAAPGAVGLALYELQAKAYVQPLGELPGFYFERGRETVASFLVRNLRTLVNWFSPIALPRARIAVPLLVLFTALVVGAAAAERRGGERIGRRLLPAAFFVVLLTVGALFGVAGLYPFGGWMRQQFLIFVFGLFAAFVGLDRFARAASPTARRAALGLAAAALAANFTLGLPRLLHPAPEPMLAKVAAFESRFPDAATVHVDQFHFVALFIPYHRFAWTYAGAEPDAPSIERYVVHRPGRPLTLVAHRAWWVFDFTEQPFYRELGSVFGRDGSGCENLFSVSPTIYKPVPRFLTAAERTTRTQSVSEALAAEGLEARGLDVTPAGDLFAKVCVAEAPRVERVVPDGTEVGRGFQVQPRGDSALSVHGIGFRRGSAVVLGGRRLETTFGNAGWMTASVPPELYAKPGRLELKVVDPAGRASNAVPFDVRPPAPSGR